MIEASERRVCRVTGQPRSTQRRAAPPDPYRDRLVVTLRELAIEHLRRGCRHIVIHCGRSAGRSVPG